MRVIAVSSALVTDDATFGCNPRHSITNISVFLGHRGLMHEGTERFMGGAIH